MILSIRTDKPEAEIGIYDSQKKIDYYTWQAHRELSSTIHQKIESLLGQNKLKYQDLTGLAVFEGPGSFTGLRIGLSVANALAYGLEIPIAATQGEDWQKTAIDKLLSGKTDKIVTPFYSEPAKTTNPRK